MNFLSIFTSKFKDVEPMFVFDDSVIAKGYTSKKLFDIGYTENSNGITFSHPVETNMRFVTKRLIEENPNITMKTIQEAVDEWDGWDGTDDDCIKSFSGKPEIDNPEALFAWIYYQAEGSWPAEKSKGSPELTGPIVFKNAKQKIAYAAVLVPGEPDQDFDKGEKILGAEEIERVAHQWLGEYGNVDLLHSLNNVALPVESYLLPMEMEVEAYGKKLLLPKGTWILASKILQDDVWDKVDKGLLTGYSVMGIKKSALKYAVGAVKSGNTDALVASFKKTLIKDLGDDWIAPFVSIVDEPCVPKAKFFALKHKVDKEVTKGGLLNAIKSKLKGTEPAEKGSKTFSDEILTGLKQAVEMLTSVVQKAESEGGPNKLKGGDDLDENEIRELVESTIKTAVDPILVQIEALAVKSIEELDSSDDGDDGDVDDGNKNSPALEEALKVLSEKVEELEKTPQHKAASKSLKGQEGDNGDPDSTVDDDRDAYGRRRKKL